MTEPGAADLIRRLRAGDRDAAGLYYDLYFDAMYLAAGSVVGADEAACLDVVHDAMLKVIAAPPPASSAGYLDAWSRKVAKSVAIDRLRGEARRVRREAAATDGTPAEVSSPLTDEVPPSDRVRGLLGRCDAAARDLLRWRYLEGLTLREIGLRLGLKTGAVDGRVRRAVAALRTSAREEFGDELA